MYENTIFTLGNYKKNLHFRFGLAWWSLTPCSFAQTCPKPQCDYPMGILEHLVKWEGKGNNNPKKKKNYKTMKNTITFHNIQKQFSCIWEAGYKWQVIISALFFYAFSIVSSSTSGGEKKHGNSLVNEQVTGKAKIGVGVHTYTPTQDTYTNIYTCSSYLSLKICKGKRIPVYSLTHKCLFCFSLWPAIPKLLVKNELYKNKEPTNSLWPRIVCVCVCV